MNMKSAVLTTMALLTLVLAWWYWEHRDLLLERQRLNICLEKVRQEEATLQQLAKRKDSASRAAADVAPAIGQRRRQKQDDESAGKPDFRVVIGRHPELRQSYLRGLVATLYTKWGLLFKELGLSPDQISRFIEIQVRLEADKIDLTAQGYDIALMPTDPDVAAKYALPEKDANQAIRDLIGTDNFSTYQNYRKNAAALTLVVDLPHFGSPTTDPLTDAQIAQLTQVLADASVRRPSGSVIYGTVDWQVALPAAQSLLSPNQFEAMELMEAEKINQWQEEQANGKAP